jgi:hypothetical protein
MREIRCIGCGQLNRIPRYTVRRIPRCAICHAKLPEPQAVTSLRDIYIYRGRILLVLGVVAGIAAALVFGHSSVTPQPQAPEAHLAPTKPAPDFSAMARPPEPIAPIQATCAILPGNGDALSLWAPPIGPHKLVIDNGTSEFAIIKVRYAATRRVAVAFLVYPNSTQYFPLADGVYRVEYATGKALGSDCRSLAKIDAAHQFPNDDTFDDSVDSVSYTLYSVPGGNVIPRSISAEQFNAP